MKLIHLALGRSVNWSGTTLLARMLIVVLALYTLVGTGAFKPGQAHAAGYNGSSSPCNWWTLDENDDPPMGFEVGVLTNENISAYYSSYPPMQLVTGTYIGFDNTNFEDLLMDSITFTNGGFSVLYKNSSGTVGFNAGPQYFQTSGAVWPSGAWGQAFYSGNVVTIPTNPGSILYNELFSTGDGTVPEYSGCSLSVNIAS
jgi:hypothetical protein